MNRIVMLIASMTLCVSGCVVVSYRGSEAERTSMASTSERVEPPAWQAAEAGMLEHHVQLTSTERFVKAGESYFSPDDSRVIFQAVELPPEGEAADEFYAMFVGHVKRDGRGRITGLDDVRRISPTGSANTCGWFHPTDPNLVLFASTIVAPTESNPPGFQRASGRYRWMFPPEMRVLQADLRSLDVDDPATYQVLAGDGAAYQAECSLTRDGRHMLYCSLESGEGDLYVEDRSDPQRPVRTRLVSARGYDGGPFFSPDERRICYRSDRHNDHKLQLFVADLVRNERGSIVGISREYQLTNDENVNWCPFWHPGGRYLVYATSAVGHHNYEVFLVDADPGDVPGSAGTIRYGTRPRRVTNAEGADVLPAFSSDGRTMIWTSKRGSAGTSQLWAADFVVDPDARPEASSGYEHSKRN